MGTQDVQASGFAQELEAKVARLTSQRQEWQNKSFADKITILKELHGRVLHSMHGWGKAGAALRGLENDKFVVGEQTLITPLVLVKYIEALIRTFESLQKEGKCPSVSTSTTSSGQVKAKVFPSCSAEVDFRLAGCTADLYVQPGCAPTQGSIYTGETRGGGKLAAVLGAGNLGFLGAKDVLYMLFEQNNVVLFKPHTVQAEWHKHTDVFLAPLIAGGFYASVYTDIIAETQQMVYHPAVEIVHMTGGTATHDAIVWGPTQEEQARRKAANDPVLKVPITSELGCVTPWIITPGAWTEAQLKEHAMAAATALYVLNGCACNGLKVLIVPESWPQADAYITRVKDFLRTMALQPAFYPGHNQRYNAWRAMFPDADVIDAPIEPSSKDFGGAKPMPYAIQELPYPAPEQELTEQQKYAFNVEPFAPVMSIVRVPSSSAPEYMSAATALANRIWGTLSCVVVVHPDMERDHHQAVEKMLDELEYGSVCVNCYSGAGYAIPHCLWGAYAGNQTIKDVGSGIGFVNNTLMFDQPQKVVVRLPFFNGANIKPIKTMGLPAWSFAPLTGFLVGGVRGLWTAIRTKREQ